MQNTVTSRGLTNIQTAVLECIVYSDLFDFPQAPEEILRWLRIPATHKDVEAALESEPLASMLSVAAPFVTLRGREAIVALRERRRVSSATLQRNAERYGALIARLPFVRMVALTGSLAVENADDNDDLDYLIVTAPGRVWLTRTMIMIIGRIAALRGVTLCPNYLLAETALALPEHDSYTARELLQMRPLAGLATHEHMLKANAWWQNYLPNASPTGHSVVPQHAGALPAGHGLTRRIAEALLRLPPFDALERWILARKGAELRRQAGGPEAVFDETMCKGHFEAWKEHTRRRLEARLRELQPKLQDSSCSGHRGPLESMP